MKIKRFENFINENNNNFFHCEYMNNTERKLLQKFIDILYTDNWDDLPTSLKRTNGSYEDAIVMFLFDIDNTEFKDIFNKYYLNNYDYNDGKVNEELLINYINWMYSDWNDGLLTSEDILEDLVLHFKNTLLENGMTSKNKIIFLSDVDDLAIPSKKTINKFKL